MNAAYSLQALHHLLTRIRVVTLNFSEVKFAFLRFNINLSFNEVSNIEAARLLFRLGLRFELQV
jgi:hypothetical protein